MEWNGKEFVGEPIALSWIETTELFGKGVAVGTYKERIDCKYLSLSDYSNGYKRGCCRVDHDKWSDWRLPTAKELSRLILFNNDEELFSSEQFQKIEPKIKLIDYLFPNLKKTEYKLWSATADGICAYGSGGKGNIGYSLTDIKIDRKIKHYIVLVRQL